MWFARNWSVVLGLAGVWISSSNCDLELVDGNDAGLGGSATGGSAAGGNGAGGSATGGLASVCIGTTVASLPAMYTKCTTEGESRCDPSGNRCVCQRGRWYCTTLCASTYPTEPPPYSECISGAACHYPSNASCTCVNSHWWCMGTSDCPAAADMPTTGEACNEFPARECDYPDQNPAFRMWCACSFNDDASTGSTWTCIQTAQCPTTQPPYDLNATCMGPAVCSYDSAHCTCWGSGPWVCGLGVLRQPAADIDFDIDNCGATGRSCSTENVAERSCRGGVCTSTCQTGWFNVSEPESGPDDGCETSAEGVPCDSPGAVVVQAIATGASHTCARTTTGGVRCWGYNGYGQLGDGSTTYPRYRSTLPASDVLTGVQSIEAGMFHTCALTTTGGVRCWGSNNRGQLGDGTTTDRSRPPTADVLSGVQAIAAGSNVTCAVMASGGVRCWGYNGSGGLGDGTTTDSSTPPASDVLTGVQAIAASGHTCARTATGGVRCWGYNGSGQLGDGTATSRSTPPATDVLTGVQAIAAGSAHTCALMTTGGVRCWGLNQHGQLGDGTTTNRSIPPASDVLTGVQAIAAGSFHTCALMTNGGVRCWGLNEYGQVGDGGLQDAWTPTRVVGVCR